MANISSTDGCVLDNGMPEDVLFHLLLLLPVVSLLRSKLVCKSWRILIESYDFVAQHRILHRRRHFTSFTDANDNGDLIFLSAPGRSNEQYLSLLSAEKSHPLDFPIIDDPYKFLPVKMVASCNGIICLHQSRRLCLWNPATKQSRNLPPLPIIPMEFGNFIGIGFDAKTNDYKVVHVCYGFKYAIHVYSSRTDCWKSIPMDDSVLEVVSPTRDRGIEVPYHGGIYCWLGTYDYDYRPYDGLDGRIISFDFSNESIGTIALPDGFTESVLFLDLAILRDNIACINWVPTASASWDLWHFEIWMLNEYNNKDSWTKLYTVGPFSVEWHSVMTFSKKGDFLVFPQDMKLCLCDLVTQEIMHLPVQVSHGYELVMYEESLVSVKRRNEASSRVTCEEENGSRGWCGVRMTEEVMFHILLWLPVVSLVRFKSVCKSWYSLINSSYLVTQHKEKGKNNKNNNLIFVAGWYLNFASYPSPNVSFACLLSAEKYQLLDFPYLRGWYRGSVDIATSFDGIICLQHTDLNHVCLWNPATKEFKAVLLAPQGGDDYSVGFGFDANTNDYKVVRIYRQNLRSEIKVYSLNSDSWKSIEDDVISHTLNCIYSGPQAPFRRGGMYCWLGLTERMITCIVSFDFTMEVFGIVELPDQFQTLSKWELELAILRENIACVAKVGFEWEMATFPNLEIWVMNEYGVKESWTKLYTVESSLGRDWLWLMEDFLLLFKDGILLLYNLLTQEMEPLPIQVQFEVNNIILYSHSFRVVVYEESLVSLHRGNNDAVASTSAAV